MKKLLSLLIILFICSCASVREDYYVFSFDDFTIAPGYDKADFMKLVFTIPDLPATLEKDQTAKELEMFFWGKYMGEIDVANRGKKAIEGDEALVERFELYLSNLEYNVLRINGIELSESVKDNCTTFNGTYVERNGYACMFGQIVKGKKNVVILYGDILADDQDRLAHLEIYVE